jgi:hypothetical protein
VLWVNQSQQDQHPTLPSEYIAKECKNIVIPNLTLGAQYFFIAHQISINVPKITQVTV